MILDVLFAGLKALEQYLVLNFLTILVPAFLLAGAIVTFVSRDAIVGCLGSRAKKRSSFSIAAGSGFFLAVCSMTVIPIASSVYASGAALGAVFVLIWMAPASNILALVYTNTVLGPSMVIARLVSALLSSFIIGITIYFIFRKGERIKTQGVPRDKKKLISLTGIILILLLIAWLLIPNYVSTLYYWQKLIVWGAGLLIVAGSVTKLASKCELKAWLQQTLSFFKSIMPLLMAGIFIIGIIGVLLPAEWVSQWLGGNGFSQSLISSTIGAICYFPNLSEVAFTDTLMKLGMGHGPALALLITAAGTSLPSWLAIGKVFGVKKALVFAPTVITLGAIVGWIAGAMPSLFG